MMAGFSSYIPPYGYTAPAAATQPTQPTQPTAATPPPAAPTAQASALDQLTPEMIQQMVALGTLSEEQAAILLDRQRSQDVMDRGLRGGFETRGGFVADSPLSGLAKIVRDKKERDAINLGREREEAIRAEQTKARQDVANAVMAARDGQERRFSPAPEREKPEDIISNLLRGGA